MNLGRKRKKTETTKHIYGRKRNWPKLSKPVIFGAENENEFRSLSMVHNPKPNKNPQSNTTIKYPGNYSEHNTKKDYDNGLSMHITLNILHALTL